MATAATGWSCVCIASLDSETDTTAKIKVTSYWQNNSWDYDINRVSSWVYCGSDSYQVMDSGSVNSTGVGTSGKVSLGSYIFTVNKTTSSQSISCYAKITSNSSYVSGTKTSSTVTVTVPAKTSYTVTFNANGGSGAPSAQTKWHGTALTLSSTKPTRSGYTFVGWGSSSTDTTVDYNAGGSYTSNASATLYAIWRAAVTLAYNANGGSGAPSNVNDYIYNAATSKSFTVSSTKPIRTGYTFLGWNTSSTATSATYTSGNSVSVGAGKTVTLYAVWSENALTINYYSNYATYGTYKGEALNVSASSNVLVDSQTHYYDNVYANGMTNIQNTDYLYLSRTGYTPTEYWGTSTSGGTLVDQNTSFSTGQALAQALGKNLSSGNASVSVYAQWNINTYTFTYNANGGTGSMSSQTVDWNGTITLSNNTFKREGYKFVGWNAYRNIDNTWYVTGQGWKTESEITSNGYEKKVYPNQESLTFNNSWISGNESVISQYTMYAVWEISGVVYIDNGTSFEPYLAYIDNGTSWDLYLMYVDDGTNWNIIS